MGMNIEPAGRDRGTRGEPPSTSGEDRNFTSPQKRLDKEQSLDPSPHAQDKKETTNENEKETCDSATHSAEELSYLKNLFSGPLLFTDYRFVSMESKGFDELLTLEETPGFFERLFGVRPHEVHFIGSCTVWYSYPGFRRQGTFMEGMLCNFWKMGEFFRDNSS